MPLSCGDRPFLAWTYPPALSQVGHRFADTGELHCRRWRYPPCNWLSPTAPWYIEGYSDHHLLLECFPYRKSTKRLSFVLLHRVVSVLSARAPYRPSILPGSTSVKQTNSYPACQSASCVVLTRFLK